MLFLYLPLFITVVCIAVYFRKVFVIVVFFVVVIVIVFDVCFLGLFPIVFSAFNINFIAVIIIYFILHYFVVVVFFQFFLVLLLESLL